MPLIPSNTQIETALAAAATQEANAETVSNMSHLYNLIRKVGNDPYGCDLDAIRDAQGDKVMTIERYFELKMKVGGFQMILNEWRVGILKALR